MIGIQGAIVGRLGQDAQLRYTAHGVTMLTFSVAVADTDPVEWVRVAVFGELTEQLAGRLLRGQLVRAEGRIRTKLYRGRHGPTADVELYATTIELAEAPAGRQRSARSTRRAGRPIRQDGGYATYVRLSEPDVLLRTNPGLGG